ncbi:hypothetical protein SK128_027704 [Halocaridina rubra]|uniref:Uncharacterized protein n=1 Tax=Halocaridina rubra TaxID=373956 RepID=A0AAN8X6C1_HALRR
MKVFEVIVISYHAGNSLKRVYEFRIRGAFWHTSKAESNVRDCSFVVLASPPSVGDFLRSTEGLIFCVWKRSTECCSHRNPLHMRVLAMNAVLSQLNSFAAFPLDRFKTINR